ncbi:MAG: hypothetical protein IJ683_04205 [Butyrivibrio sp.]|nr:hypothetical protein [Butyrivibrio sp.]MBR1641510.1 hypothetical protein [Butyrivibrio sp.]
MRIQKRKLIPVISLIIWMLAILTGYVSYDVNDDTALNMIGVGALGTGRQYLIYSNILLGYFLEFLSVCFPYINCYLWFYLVMDLLAVIAISLIITDSMNNRTAAVTTVGINLLFVGEFYVHITYTKSAALFGTAGLITLMWLIKKGKRDWGLMLLSFVLITFGMWARWKAFALCVPFVLGVELIDIASDVIGKKEKIHLKKYVPLFVAVAICVASFVVDSLAYRLDDGWNEFRKTDNLLIEMRDNNRYLFGDAPDEYIEAGITENDFNMIRGNWMWNDPNYFNSERLGKLKEIGIKHDPGILRFDVSLIKGTIKELIYILSSKSFGIVFVILLLLAVIRGNKAMFIKLVYVSFVFAGEMYYMFCLNRVLWRAEVGTVLAAVLTLAYLVALTMEDARKEQKQVRKAYYAFAAAIIIAFIFTKTLLIDNSRYTNGDNKYEEFQELTKADAFFVVQDFSQYGMLLGAQNIFDISSGKYKNYYSNLVELGGVAQSPAGMYFAGQNGITNPVEALIDADSTFFVGGGYRLTGIA